jgi:hypothetical protein
VRTFELLINATKGEPTRATTAQGYLYQTDLCGRGKLANMANDVVVLVRFRQEPAFLRQTRVMRTGTRGSKKQRDFGPVFSGMMRKGKTVHGPRHLDIGKQHMDTGGVDLENAQGGFGVFDVHHLEACILERIDDNQADQFLVFRHKDKIWSGIACPLR